MRILLVSDEECAFFWDHFQPGCLDNIDLILSCGDLKPDYLSFLVTMGKAPVYYVHGNHDDCYARNPPEGCECIEDTVITFNGLRILGLGGSQRYKETGVHQYTEKEMERRIRKLQRTLRKSGGVDIIVTHAPVRGHGDEETLVHRGFEAFLPLLEAYHPKLWAYGHVHSNYSANSVRCEKYGDTMLINACERYVVDI